MKIDETLKNNLIADVENIADTNLRPQTKAALKRAFEITIGHHYADLPPSEEKKCEHYIVDARNEVIKNGYMCIKCNAIFAGSHPENSEEKKEIKPTIEGEKLTLKEKAQEIIMKNRGFDPSID
jgi:hypothetical protein